MGIQPSLEILTATKVAISMLEFRVPAWMCFETKAHIKEFGYSLLFWVLEAKHRSNKVFADKLSFSTAQRIALRGVVPLNAQTNQGTSPSGRRRRRSAPATIRKRSWGIPAERWAVHREILVGIVRHYPAAFKSGGEGGVHQDFPMYKKKRQTFMHSQHLPFIVKFVSVESVYLPRYQNHCNSVNNWNFEKSLWEHTLECLSIENIKKFSIFSNF